LPSGKNPKHIRQKKKTNEGADEKNEEYYNEPGRVVLPNTRRDQVLPDHVVFNYRRVRVRGTFLEEVLFFFSLSLFVLKRRHHLCGIFGIKSMFTHLL
jgi:hypothetical protein